MSLESAVGLTHTVWLRCLCLAVPAGLLVGICLWRTCRIAKRRSESVQERLRERERSARALHDTLLQSMQGLILRFHGIAKRLPAQDATRVGIETILDQADAIVTESRNDVLDLGSQPVTGGDVIDALSDFGKSMQETFGPRFTVAMSGKPRVIDARTWRGIYAIGCEALLHAYLHAGARHIQAAIVYGPDAFCLIVRDDGHGMQDDGAYQGGQAGHRKLAGMAAHARLMGGSVAVRRRDGKGSELALRIPV